MDRNKQDLNGCPGGFGISPNDSNPSDVVQREETSGLYALEENARFSEESLGWESDEYAGTYYYIVDFVYANQEFSQRKKKSTSRTQASPLEWQAFN